MKTPISFKSLNLVCKQNTFWNVKRDIQRRENTAIDAGSKSSTLEMIATWCLKHSTITPDSGPKLPSVTFHKVIFLEKGEKAGG